ncbi:roadblock/LC7 domain-containing protein [Methylomonas sp. SURF-2]|uniref:Roadblock/LC7 domain-containing protein n=1 Tax=Methylomonas subterranea TaxID=2952225 RepID=A0ABT1TJA8_9GAMM|nr:roadblock/LC7 domain-containing protein [Methylomonas sp. SURF-2]MCQ8105554.1 roadblock/LC7 domain-containing protein [Methylomonas sp. SURF-2]
MHWFQSQLAALNRLADQYARAQRPSASNIVNVSENMRLKRAEFIDAVQALVNQVGKIKGISSCAAYHDGLILARSADVSAIDAFGATVQESARAAQQGAALLGLGDVEQIVIVGTKNKLAMLNVGPLVLCISCRKEINLAAALQRNIAPP